MEKVNKNEKVTEEKVASQPELIQDESLTKDGKRAYLSGFRKWAWNLVWKKGYGGKFFVIYLVVFGIGFFMGYLDLWLTILSGLDPDKYSLSVFGDIANAILTVGLLGFSFNIARGLVQKVENFFREITWDRVWKNFLGGILYGLACLGGFLLLIVPGIIFAVRFQFYMYAVVDKGLSPVEALKYSRRITKGRFWEIIGFDFYFVLINLLGLLCLVVGLIWTTAMTNISTARYYRLISNIYEKNLTLAQNVKK